MAAKYALEGLAAELGSVNVLRRTEKSGLGSAYRAGFAWGIEQGFDAFVERRSYPQTESDCGVAYGACHACLRVSLLLPSKHLFVASSLPFQLSLFQVLCFHHLNDLCQNRYL